MAKAQHPIWFNVTATVTAYTGRTQQLSSIADNIQKGIVVICGLSGVGKSELAIKFASSPHNQQESVVWINAETRDTIKQSFFRLAKDKLDIRTRNDDGEEKTLKCLLVEIYNYFDSAQTLFIFDKAEKHTALEEFLPFHVLSHVNKCCVLITSQNSSEWKNSLNPVTILPPLTGFTLIEAIEFVKKSLEIAVEDDTEEEWIILLVEKSYYFPLLLRHAVAYIKNENRKCLKRNSEFKISDYVRSLECGPDVKHKKKHQEFILEIFQYSIEKMKSEHSFQEALQMLNLTAYFAPNNIPIELFTNNLRNYCIIDSNSIINLLKKYCVVHSDKSMLNINGLIQEAVRLKKCQRKEDILKESLKLIKDRMLESKCLKNYVTHIISLWNYSKDYETLIDEFIVNDVGSTRYLHFIAESGSNLVLNIILNQIGKLHSLKQSDIVNAKDTKGRTALHLALNGRNEDKAINMINKGADINVEDDSHYKPIHLAAMHGLNGVLETLLERNIDVNGVTNCKYKLTPLHLAAQNGHKQIISNLLIKRANVNVKTQNKVTALHLASEYGHLAIVNILLDQKLVQIDAGNEYQHTALHLAAKKADLRVVQALLKKGAKINALDRDRCTPLHLAAQGGFLKIVEVLLSSHKVNIDVQNNDGNTPLHLAVQNDWFNVFRCLIENDANLTDKNINSKTPITLVFDGKNINMKKYVHSLSSRLKLDLDIDNFEMENNYAIGPYAKWENRFLKTGASIDGQLYEIKLLTMLLLQGLSENMYSFELASNMRNAFQMDDIVFSCKYKDVKDPTIIFLQAKHRRKDDNKNKLITLDHLFPNTELKKNDFSLLKYFDSYLKIRQQFSEANYKNPIFGCKFELTHCEFIIYTNAEPSFVARDFGNAGVAIEKMRIDRDSIFNCSIDKNSEQYYYRIVRGKNKKLDEKIQVLKQVSDNEKDIDEFLSKLKLFVGQPNQNELGDCVKHKIQKAYNVEPDDINSVFSIVQSKMLEWWNTHDYYLTKKNRFFKDAIGICIIFDIIPPIDSFTGRGSALKTIHEVLHRKNKVDIPQAASITGPGGIGKSEMARKYLHSHSNKYDDNLIWINASSYQTIVDSFQRLAQDKLGLNITSIDINIIVRDVYSYFANKHRKSIFVFDNATKYRSYKAEDDGIENFLPSGPDKPCILITSRNQEWPNITTLPLETFTAEEAVEFIKTALNIGIDTENNEVLLLAETVQYFPLALQQAAAYIKQQNERLPLSDRRGFTINDYYWYYNYTKSKKLLMQAPLLGIEDRYTEKVLTTWTLTIDQIEGTRDGTAAIDILNVLAYLAPDNVPIEEMFLNLVNDTEIRHAAVEMLHQYSMVHLDSAMLRIHGQLQQIIRMSLENQEEEIDILSTTYNLLIDSSPFQSMTMEDYGKKRRFMPHLEIFLSHVDEQVMKSVDKEDLRILYHLLEGILRCMCNGYCDFANPRRQNELLERLLILQINRYGKDDVIVADTLMNIATSSAYLGNFQYELVLFKQALKIKEKHYGPEHPEVADTKVSLGSSHLRLGNTQKAKEMIEGALPILKKYYGKHDSVVKCLLHLEHVYYRLGDHNKRKEIIEQALAMSNEIHGPDNVKTINILGSLGDAYLYLGDTTKAKNLLEQDLLFKENHYGPNNFIVAVPLSSLAIVYGKLSDYQKMRELLERTLSIEETHYGRDHIQTAPTLISLGRAFGILGHPRKEVELLECSLAIQKDHYRPDHESIAYTSVRLGDAYRELGHYQKSKELIEIAFPIQEKHFGSDNSKVARTLISLGLAYGNLGDMKRKRDLIEKALSIQEKYYGSNHVKVANTIINLGATYEKLGNPQRTLQLIEKALPIQEKHYGTKHFVVAKTLTYLALAHRALGNAHKQKKLVKIALPLLEKHYGPQHIKVAETLIILGSAYGALGDANEHKKLLEKTLPIQQSFYGPDHIDIAPTLKSLATAYGALGDMQTQKRLLERALAIQEKYYGFEHHEVAYTLVSLRTAFGELGNIQKHKELD